MRRAARTNFEALDQIIRLPALAAVWAVGFAGAGIGWYSGSYALNDGLPSIAFVYEKRCSGESWTGPHALQASTPLDARQHLRKVHPGCQIKAYRPV